MSSEKRAAVDEREVRPWAGLEELEQLFDHAPVGICLVDRECRYLRANQAYAQIVGREEHDLRGRHMLEVIPPSARDGAVAAAMQVMETAEPILELELRRFTEDAAGEERIWLVNIHPVHRDGLVTGSMAVLQNITSVRRAEEVALARLSELEAIYRNAPVGLSFLDRDLRYLRANQIIADLNGCTIEEVVGKTYRELSPETADQAEPFLRKIVREGRSLRNSEMRSRPPADPEHEHVFLLSMDPVHSPAGEILGHTSSIQDVTELRRLQETSAQRLRQLEILYAHSPIGLCFMDAELRVVHLNPLFGHLSHLPSSEQIGASAEELMPEPIASQILPGIRYAIKSGMASLRVQIHGRQPAPESLDHTWLADAHPVLGSDGAITGVISVLQDVTVLAERQHQLESVRDRLAEAQQLAHLGSWEWNIIEDSVWWSREIYEIFGEGPGLEPSFADVVERVHPDDRQKFRDQIDQTLEHDRPFRQTMRIVRPDGTERVVLSAARLERTPDGTPARMIGAAQDVTDFTPVERSRANRTS